VPPERQKQKAVMHRQVQITQDSGMFCSRVILFCRFPALILYKKTPQDPTD